MDQETLNTLMTLVVLPLLVGVSGFAVAWLRKKTQEITEIRPRPWMKCC